MEVEGKGEVGGGGAEVLEGEWGNDRNLEHGNDCGTGKRRNANNHIGWFVRAKVLPQPDCERSCCRISEGFSISSNTNHSAAFTNMG